MWKTLGGFWANLRPFGNILPSKNAQVHCGAVGLSFFRKPYLIAQFGPLFPISLAKNGYGACCRAYFQRRESGSDLVNANFVKSVSGKNPRFALELALAFNRDQ
jgi:hypothetical protein